MRARPGARARLRAIAPWLAVMVLAPTVVSATVQQSELLLDPEDSAWSATAPDVFQVAFSTSTGAFVLEVHRAWSPHGADRFYNLVRHGFYDDSRFYRVVEGFIVQFGLPGDPAVTPHWLDRTIPDDPVAETNVRGMVTYAMTGPDTRTTQIYVNLVDNTRLDAQGFSPFARVVSGMDVVDRIHSGYGENAGGGLRRGDQSRIIAEGNAHLDRDYPELDRILRARVVDPPTVGRVEPPTARAATPDASGPDASEPDAAGPLPFDSAALSAYVTSFMSSAQLPAVAIAVVAADRTLYEAGFGDADGAGAPVTAGSRFLMGATSEVLTALAIMQLADAGRVELDAPVRRYLPDLELQNEGLADRLTVRHLLEHTSGLAPIAAFNRRVRLEGRLDRVGFAHEPGAEVARSGLDFLLLRRVLESVSEEPYGAYMDRHVFGPLGMRSTGATPTRKEPEASVRGHSYVFGWPVSRPRSADLSGAATGAPDGAAEAAAGGPVAASASDLGRFVALFLNRGRWGDRQLLAPAGITEMGGGEDGSEDWRGLGWRVEDVAGRRALVHTASVPGFHTTLAVLPDEGYGVVVMASRSAGPILDAPTELAWGILGRVLGLPARTYVPWERLLHLSLLVVLLMEIAKAFRWSRRWQALGRPRATTHTVPIVTRLVLDLTVAAALPLVALFGFAKMSIQALFELYPDVGLAIAIFPLLAIPTAVWRTLVRSEEWRAGARAKSLDAAPPEPPDRPPG